MRPKQKRSGGLSPQVIRALGVLAITLMAMTTSPAGGASVPNCDGCPPMDSAECFPTCDDRTGSRCLAQAGPSRCRSSCYVWKCTDVECTPRGGKPDSGTRVECVLDGGAPW